MSHIFVDCGFKNELSYCFCFIQEAEYIKEMLNELIGSGSLQFRIMDDDLSTLKTLRIIACDEPTFLILKTIIELHKECYLSKRKGTLDDYNC